MLHASLVACPITQKCTNKIWKNFPFQAYLNCIYVDTSTKRWLDLLNVINKPLYQCISS